MKLQTYLAHAGIASRRKAEELIASGQIKVNNQVATIGQRIDPQTDVVMFKNTRVQLASQWTTYLVYKPAGVVSTTHDELGRRTIVEYLRTQVPPTVKLPRLYPVGRLDADSEGLMILTNNGELTQHMTHPSYEVEKTYRITVLGHPTEKALAHLARGVRLKEGMTAPAKVHELDHILTETTLEITIHEGRYHQVKRMMLRVGYEVTKLIRVQMGPYTLSDLKGNTYKEIQQ